MSAAVYLLGTPRLERDGLPVQIRRRKTTALLAYLAVTGREHSRDMLAALFWPDGDRVQAHAGLRRSLSELRQVLGAEYVAADRERIELCAPLWLDVRVFYDRLAQVKAHCPPPGAVCPACLTALDDAAVLCGGEFMAGFDLPHSAVFEEWQLDQARCLQRELGGALARLAFGHSALGALEAAIGYARRWVALDAFHEPAQRLLMQLYADSGQSAAALRQYAACERVLREELGVSPEAQTVQLYQTIRAGRDSSAPGPAPTAASPAELPAHLTPFVGRQRELAWIEDRLRDPSCRLLTLAGAGGMGKTRLALEAAARLADAFPHGVYFVPLAALRSADAIVPAIAQALGFTFGRYGDPREQLVAYLRPRRLLLVLDNLEHLRADADEDGVVEMLRAAPEVKILVTSRIRLNVYGEHLFTVLGLDYPPLDPVQREKDAASPTPRLLDYSAVQLFLSAAWRVRPDLKWREQDLNEVACICRLVQGMPLAILLAASWVQLYSAAEIAAEIGRSLDLLTTDERGMPAEGGTGQEAERQRSVRTVFDRSWELLTEHERELLQGLSVMAGFDRPAAEQIVGAQGRDLIGLANKSLLYITPAGRIEMHELLRRYAKEKRTGSPTDRAIRDRHCAYYMALLAGWDLEWDHPDWQAVMAALDDEAENARLAWDRAVVQGDLGRLERALDALCGYYYWRRRNQEGLAACQAALEGLPAGEVDLSGSPAAGRLCWLLARILAWQSRSQAKLKEVEIAAALLDRALDLLHGRVPDDEEPWTREAYAPLRMAGLLRRAQTTGRSAALVLADLDDFRRINLTYGIQAGDAVLAGMARIIRASAQESLFGRWSAEEFLILIPDADESGAWALADRVRQRIAAHTFAGDEGRPVQVTASLGVAFYPRHAGDLFGLLACADRAVRQAKAEGKNRVSLFAGD